MGWSRMGKLWLTLKLKDGREGSCAINLTAESVEHYETLPMTPRIAAAAAAWLLSWEAGMFDLKVSELPVRAEEWALELCDDDGRRTWLATERYRPSGRSSVYARDRERSPRVARCCSVLKKSSRLLPRRVRLEALDEWIDDLITAELRGRSVHRRTGSILLRALPSLIWSELRSWSTRATRVRDD